MTRTQLKITVMPVKDRAEGISVLESGAADAFAGDKILLAAAQYQNPQGLVILPDDLSIEPYAIVLPLGDLNFRLAVNAGLADMYRRGAMIPIYQKWSRASAWSRACCSKRCSCWVRCPSEGSRSR